MCSPMAKQVLSYSVISRSCVINTFSSSSVRNSRSFTLGLMWNCANGFLGISPLKWARITTPLSHMHFSHIVPLCSPAILVFLIAKLNINESDLDKPTEATSCQIRHGVLKITFRRVTI